MIRSLRPTARKTMRRRVALTVSGAAVLLVGLWWSQTQMPDGDALMRGIRYTMGKERARTESHGARSAPTMLTKTLAAAFPTIVIIRPDEGEAAFMAQQFADALTDAGLYPRIETVLLEPGRSGAPCKVRSALVPNLSNPTGDGNALPALVYAMGGCAMRNAIASAHYGRRLAALSVGDADTVDAMYRPAPMIFSDVEEWDARVLVPQAQRAGQVVRGVLAAPTQATQLQWARRYLPHAASVRIGYWSNASTASTASTALTSTASPPPLHVDRLIGLRDAARESASGYGRVGGIAPDDDPYEEDIAHDTTIAGAIEIVAASGPPAEVIAQWRARGIRLLYVDGATPVAVVQAAVAAGLGTFCAADADSRGAMRGLCLLQVMPLRQAAPSMAAYLASRLLATPHGTGRPPIDALASLWQGPPQGPLQLDIRLARKMGQMPPLSLLDDVDVVEVEREAARPLAYRDGHSGT